MEEVDQAQGFDAQHTTHNTHYNTTASLIDYILIYFKNNDENLFTIDTRVATSDGINGFPRGNSNRVRVYVAQYYLEMNIIFT